ncbi:MAG TPA: glycosyltransferase family 4 protein [Pseudolabrys sp.]|nr:glycosyltransferase family 4 protein [Pseudolabrys sp.]
MAPSAERATTGEGAAPAVLMLFLEPAPYIVAFVAAARKVWPGRIDVLYAATQLSQDWGTRIDEGDVVLPRSQRLALAEIKRRIASRRYALVHLAGWGHPLLWRTMLYAARRVPVTVQSDTPAPRGEPAWKRYIKRAVYGVLFRIPKMFTPAGTPQADYVRSFGAAPSRIRIAQLTVDVAAIQEFTAKMASRRTAVRSSMGLADEDLAILYVGRLEPHKGIDDLIDAFTALSRQIPSAKLLIAGDGSLRERVMALAARTHAVHYLGRLAGEAVWEAYGAADMFVLPSRFEPWGLVVNEAMAAGLPVVVTDCVGCARDLVRPGVSGLIVPASAPKLLAEAMEKLCGDAALRQRMADAARQIISGWTLANQASNTLSAWRQVLSLPN